jgi:hypothetical protein
MKTEENVGQISLYILDNKACQSRQATKQHQNFRALQQLFVSGLYHMMLKISRGLNSRSQ